MSGDSEGHCLAKATISACRLLSTFAVKIQGSPGCNISHIASHIVAGYPVQQSKPIISMVISITRNME